MMKKHVKVPKAMFIQGQRHTPVWVNADEKRMLRQVRGAPPIVKHGVPAYPSGTMSTAGNTTRSTSVGGGGASSNSTGASNYGGSSTAGRSTGGSSNSTGASNYGGGSTSSGTSGGKSSGNLGSSNSTGASNYGGGGVSAQGGNKSGNNASSNSTGPGNYGGSVGGGTGPRGPTGPQGQPRSSPAGGGAPGAVSRTTSSGTRIGPHGGSGPAGPALTPGGGGAPITGQRGVTGPNGEPRVGPSSLDALGLRNQTFSNPRDIAVTHMIARGWTPEQASGIVGNLAVEAPGFNPNALYAKEKSFGLAQWRGARLKGLQKFAGTKTPSFNAQLDYIDRELRGTATPADFGAMRAGQQFMSDPQMAPSTAAMTFSNKYERPNKALSQNSRRVSEANNALASLGLSGQPAPVQTASLGPIATSSTNPNAKIAAQLASAALPRPSPPIPQQRPAPIPSMKPSAMNISPAELQQAINGNLAPAENNRAPTSASPPMVAGGGVPGFQTSIRGRPEFSAMGGMPAAPAAPSSAGMPAWSGSYTRPEFSGMGGFPAAQQTVNTAGKSDPGIQPLGPGFQPTSIMDASMPAPVMPSRPMVGRAALPQMPTRGLKQDQQQVPQQTSGIGRPIDVADMAGMGVGNPFDPVPTKQDLDRIEQGQFSLPANPTMPQPAPNRPSTTSSSISSAPASTVYGGIATPQQMLDGSPRTQKGFGIDVQQPGQVPGRPSQMVQAEPAVTGEEYPHPGTLDSIKGRLQQGGRINRNIIQRNADERRGIGARGSVSDRQRRLVRAMMARSQRTTSTPVDPFAGMSPGQILYQTV